MILGGVVEIFLGVAAEGKSLEDIAKPLSMVGKAVGAVTEKPRPHSSARPPEQAVGPEPPPTSPSIMPTCT